MKSLRPKAGRLPGHDWCIGEERLNLRQVMSARHGRQTGQEQLSVTLAGQAWITQHQDAAIMHIANQSPRALLECDDRAGHLPAHEKIDAGLLQRRHKTAKTGSGSLTTV